MKCLGVAFFFDIPKSTLICGSEAYFEIVANALFVDWVDRSGRYGCGGPGENICGGVVRD
jgi:hypothetical protein